MKKVAAALPTYPGPHLDQLPKDQHQIVNELARLGEEPRQPGMIFYDDPNDLDHSFDITRPPPHWTAEQIQAVEDAHAARHLAGLRHQLHRFYMGEWVRSLPVKVRWAIVQAYERKIFHWRNIDDDFSESTKRHTTEAELNRRCIHAVWATEREQRNATESTRPASPVQSTEVSAERDVQSRGKSPRRRKAASGISSKPEASSE